MPEARFTVRSPDGRVQDHYSPSLVVHDHLVAGREYPVAEFADRTAAAMTEATERVRARFGFACTAAAATADAVTAVAATHPADARVTVLRIDPPLPAPPPPDAASAASSPRPGARS